MQGGMEAFTRWLSPGQSRITEQVLWYLTLSHRNEIQSGFKGKGIIERCLELKVSLFLAKAKHADITSGRELFSLPFSCATFSDSVTL